VPDGVVTDRIEAVASAEQVAAEQADLVYVTDEMPGIRRRGRGRGFSYVTQDGSIVRDEATLARIRWLAIPPAWSDVWISPDARGHLQATGRDAKGRKQYRYHARWAEVRGETKYERLAEIARLLPRIRARIEQDLAKPSPSRERVLATVVRLLETTLIRIGNTKYVAENGSFGLTTLRDEHVEVQGTELRFEFRGKSGKTWQLALRDRRIARTVRTCQELPGQHLFQYLDCGERVAITSTEVNAYLREASGSDISAKDIRTWAGTVLAAAALAAAEEPRNASHAKRLVSAAIRQVAARLGNTPAIARKSYVHPAVLDAFAAGLLADAFRAAHKGDERLNSEERAVLALLDRASRGNGRAA
jgi:DNA topoisomerase I